MNKSFKLFTWMLSVAMLLATACTENDEPKPTPKPEEPQPEAKLELTLAVGEVTSSSIDYTITSNKEDATYYASLFAAEELASERDIAMKAAMLTVEEAYTGSKTFSVTDLKAESEYKVLYFGYDAAEKRYTTDYLVSDVIKTAKYEISDTIALQVVEGSITWREAYVKITPSAEDMEYIFDIMEKSEWEELYAEDAEAIVAARIAGWQQDVEDGLESNPTLDTWQKYMAYYQHNYPKTVAVSEYYNLRWDTDYVMYAFGMNDDGFQTANVVTVEFRTATPVASENTFVVEIGELTASTVAFNVTASNNDPYFLTIQDKRYVDRFGEGKNESWEDMIWDLTFVKTDEQIMDYIFSGSQSLTNDDINKKVDSFHEYQVVIWGFSNGPTTEVYVSEAFNPVDPVVELSLYLDILDGTSETITCDVTANTDEVAYYLGYATAEQFGEDEGLTYLSTIYDAITVEDLFYGSGSYFIDGLAPDTEYYVFAFGYDFEAGEPITDLVYKRERTMPLATGEVFTISVNNITWRNAQISVATEYAGNYIYGILTAEEYAAFADVEALFADRKAGWEQTAEWYDGYTWVDMMVYDICFGNETFDAGEDIMTLTYGQSYVFYCLGVTTEGAIDTDIAVAEFTTLSPVASDATFEITIDAMTKSSVNFTVVPSNPEEQYYVTVQKVNTLNSYGPDKDKSYEDLIRYLLPDSDFTLESRLFTGEQSLANSNVGASVSSFYEYRVVVFGFNNGPTTTVYMSEAFKPADPA